MNRTMKTKAVAVTELRAKLRKLLDEVERNGVRILITKRGKPVARLEPLANKASDGEAPLFGRRRGAVKILGDIVGPTGEKWNAAD